MAEHALAPEDLLAHLRTLEAEVHHSNVRSTRERLEALLHRDFHEVSKSGHRFSRDFVIDAALGSQPASSSYGHTVRMISPGCALLTYRTAQSSLGRGEVVAFRASIWVNAGGNWLLCYHQGTPAAL